MGAISIFPLGSGLTNPEVGFGGDKGIAPVKPAEAALRLMTFNGTSDLLELTRMPAYRVRYGMTRAPEASGEGKRGKGFTAKRNAKHPWKNAFAFTVRWAGLLLCVGLAVQAQEFSTAPILIQPDVDLKYLKDNYVRPPDGGKTNWHRLEASRLQYGDIVRIRTRGSFAVRVPDQAQFGPEEPQSFLGFFTGVMLRPNLYHAAPLADSKLPEYKTRSILEGTKEIATDIPRDFLITPEGVTACSLPMLSSNGRPTSSSARR